MSEEQQLLKKEGEEKNENKNLQNNSNSNNPNQNNDNTKKINVEEKEEDNRNCCQKCCDGYSDCIICVCKRLYGCLVVIKNCIAACCACWWYPLKERCATCCEKCDKEKHPYKDPEHNPYDEL